MVNRAMFLIFRKAQFRKVLVAVCLATCIVCIWTRAVPAQSHQLSNLVQNGVDYYQTGNYQQAITTWQDALEQVDPDNLAHQRILLENLARAHRQTGQFSQEINYWHQVIKRHEQLNDIQSLGRALTEQAQAYNRLGQHRRALALLCGDDITTCHQSSALHIAQATLDVDGEAAALGSLGETYRLTGDYNQAITTLTQSLAIIGDRNPIFATAMLNSLGNTYGALAQIGLRRAQSASKRNDTRDEKNLRAEAEAHTQKAIEFLNQSYTTARSKQLVVGQVRSQLNLIPLYQRLAQDDAATQAWQTTQGLIQTLPNSQDKAFAMLTLAGYLEPKLTRECPAQTVKDQQVQLLEDAIAIAQSIQSSRAESFATGQLGNLYERCQNYPKALELTQSARYIADQDRSSQDSLYLWEWQQGRILKAQGNTNAATAAYTQALETLDTIRSDILNANQELQFDFRDRVEPIYREFAALKLTDIPTSIPIADKRQSVDTVLVTLDSLKLAELQNYFANDCVIVANKTRVDTVSGQSASAVISTAIWADRTAVIASFPNEQQQIEWIDIDETTLTAEINQLRVALESGRRRTRQNQYKVPSIKLYEQLVQPFEAKLAELQVNSLVFINDGILRSIPMAALYDGEQFLIQKYAISTTPSLTLTDPNALDRKNLNALILGLSEESTVGNKFFPALNKVEDEVATVNNQFPGSQVLKNIDFSETNLKRALKEKNYRILHIATHGIFGSAPEDNYIVTGQKLDDQTNKAITISELDTLIRSVSSIDRDPIDLLTLTACETAIGDNRATLGLAGVAIRAGVRSAIASLWAVDDAVTADLITRFYHHLLDSNLTKAEALRTAQLEVIDTNGHPYYWAPFILIGNWL